MGPGLLEQSLECPYCGESITMILDLSADGEQDYIEDCGVCCQPLRLRLYAEEGELHSFACERTD